MITLTEIAQKAGVSPSTVSKALRGSNDISKETIDKISVLAVEMGYSLAEKKKNFKKQWVGILCPEIISSYYARIVSKISELFRKAGLETFLAVSEFNAELELSLLDQMISMQMSAIICITEGAALSPSIRKNMVLYNIPILQIAMNQQPIGHDNICVDERMGLMLLINHLSQLGHRKIAFAGERYSERRMQYFKEAMGDHGLADDNVYITQTRHWQAGYELAEQLLVSGKRLNVTAIVAEYDDIAVGAMRCFYEAGLHAPEDYSIVGFDDAKYCRYLPVSLTTIESHVEDMCSIAFDTVIKKINDPSYKVIQNISIIPELVCRESTAVPADKMRTQ
jgi:LacI family transcriptional regulator